MRQFRVFSFLLVLILPLFLSACRQAEEKQYVNIPVVEKALHDTTSLFYADFGNYPKEMKDLPIGIFDSGTGGLTVLEKFLALDRFDNITGSTQKDSILDFAGEHFIYLADQANMPYGNYDAENNSEYLKELVVKDALFLMGDKYFMNPAEPLPSGVKPRVKIIVIGCNTATAYGLETVEQMLEQSNTGVKVIGVINAGVRATLDRLDANSSTSPFAIGVLATPGTIASGAYEKTIGGEVESRGISVAVSVVNQKGYGFAESVDNEPDFVNDSLVSVRDSYRGPELGTSDECLIRELLPLYNFDYSDGKMLCSENGEDGFPAEIQLNNASNYARFNLVSLVEKHRLSGSNVPLRAIILGCTHYPFEIETLQSTLDYLRSYCVDGRYIYRDLIADDLVFIDPAYYTAVEAYNTLRQDGNLALNTCATELDGYISVPSLSLPQSALTPDGKLTYDFKFGREVGTEEITTKQVPFSRDNIDANNLKRIEERLPYSFALINKNL